MLFLCQDFSKNEPIECPWLVKCGSGPNKNELFFFAPGFPYEEAAEELNDWFSKDIENCDDWRLFRGNLSKLFKNLLSVLNQVFLTSSLAASITSRPLLNRLMNSGERNQFCSGLVWTYPKLQSKFIEFQEKFEKGELLNVSGHSSFHYNTIHVCNYINFSLFSFNYYFVFRDISLTNSTEPSIILEKASKFVLSRKLALRFQKVIK